MKTTTTKKYLYLIRFKVLSNELQNPKYGRSASGAERPILIRSKHILIGFGNLRPVLLT